MHLILRAIMVRRMTHNLINDSNIFQKRLLNTNDFFWWLYGVYLFRMLAMHQGTRKWHLKRCTSRYMFYICSKSQSDLWCKRWNLYLCIKMHIFICVWCCKVNEIIRITMSKFSISLWKHSGLHIPVLFYATS